MTFAPKTRAYSHKIGRFFREFLPKNPAKFDFFARDLSEALLSNGITACGSASMCEFWGSIKFTVFPLFLWMGMYMINEKHKITKES